LRSSLEGRAREGIRRALQDRTAKEKSPEQLELLVIAIANEVDAIVVIGTGGGKSLAWDATALVEPGFASVVMVPYAPLLDQHLETSLARNIVAAKYTVTSRPPDDFQILFIQPETGKTTIFKQ
jgi:superfamily II DNA helicase RecQ